MLKYLKAVCIITSNTVLMPVLHLFSGNPFDLRVNVSASMFRWQDSHSMCVHAYSVTQSCPILCNPMDYSPPGSSVHGILQARILEWVAISFSRGSSPPRDQTSSIDSSFGITAHSEAVVGAREPLPQKHSHIPKCNISCMISRAP